jgi:biopolymer transport protein ExbB/TolQ
MNSAKPAVPNPVRRSATTVAAFVVGLPLAAALLFALHVGPLGNSILNRYVSHAVERVEVVLFCCALAALGAKLWQSLHERRVCQMDVVPPWDGKIVQPTEAPKLLAGLRRLPVLLQNTYLVQRVANVLDFLCQRQSAAELDDHLRTLTDNDSLALEASYSLTRFITWAIPILGFLGTVLGITGAIAGVTPEKLEKDISELTGGLALAFDATALALALTMITMFCSFLVERQEQGVLEDVDRYIDRHLAHRFERTSVEGGPIVEAVKQNTQTLLEATGQLVHKQADIWAQALAETQKRMADFQTAQQEQLTKALETALERTVQTHTQRLAALEKQAIEHTTRLFEQLAVLATTVQDTGREQQAALTRVAEGVAAQASVLGQLQRNEENLVHLQAVLHQNLAVLAGAGSFDQAVHSLTAAIHLLTARTGTLSAARPADRVVAGTVHPETAQGPRTQTGKAA